MLLMHPARVLFIFFPSFAHFSKKSLCLMAGTAARVGSLRLFRTLWGVPFPAEEPSLWSGFLHEHVTSRGFVGIECCSPGPFCSFNADLDAARDALRNAGDVKLITQVQTLDYPVASSNWKEHRDSLRRKLEDVVKFFGPTSRCPSPLELVNCHAGKDSMSLDDAIRFFESALTVESEVLSPLGVRLVFETHRQRILHNPFALLALHRHDPKVMSQIRYNADISHFVVALERLPTTDGDSEFWPEVLEILARQSHYMHCRMATPQAIQTLSARGDGSPEAEFFYKKTWSAIAGGMRSRHLDVLVCPEYGPPPYCPVGVHGQPLVNLNDLVLVSAKELQIFLR